MTITSNTTRALEKLLTLGEVPASDINPLSTGKALGLWTLSADGSRAVATSTAVQLLQALPSLPETIAAILSCEPDIRLAWGKIVAARLKELGQRRDTPELCEAIDKLAQAASALLPLLPQSALTPTHYSELERVIFEAPAEQAVATPKLLRVLGATARLVEGKQGTSAESVPDIDSEDPSDNWIKGRLLLLPSQEIQAEKVKSPHSKSGILTGNWSTLSPAELKSLAEKHPYYDPSQNPMYWVLARPWVFLLAQVTFTQEAWVAERLSGSFSLELESSQLDQFYRPPQVLVVVTTHTGEEILCGSLGELLQRVLNQLGMTILASSLTQFDSLLSPVIESLLQQQIWRFDPGSNSRRPSYTIHSAFSDSCYRVPGSKYFKRLGTPVTAAIRQTCQLWATERQALSGVSAASLS
jgi:hypothetical protein